METKRLIETENSIQEFTVRFYGGTVMIEQNQLPLGQISCELLDYPTGELLALHDEAVRLFSIVRDSLFARLYERRCDAGRCRAAPVEQGFEACVSASAVFSFEY
mgnify:CR=1 FL=1